MTERRASAAGCAFALAALTGCAVGAPAGQGYSATPRSDLAGEAEVAARNLAEQPAGRAGADNAGRADAAQGRRQGADRPGGPGGRRAARDRTGVPEWQAGAGAAGPGAAGTTGAEWVTVWSGDDAPADQGLGPGYADLRSVTLADNGSWLRITVRVAAVVPGRLAEREVQGVGIDLFRGAGVESDYQVFLDGGAYGWRAFLQTPRGFADYPGTLAVRADTVEAVLPWASLGGRGGGDVSAFLDWADGSGRATTDTSPRGAVTLP